MDSNPVEVPIFFSGKFATASIAITTAATTISLFQFVFLQFTSSPQTWVLGSKTSIFEKNLTSKVGDLDAHYKKANRENGGTNST